MLITKMSVYITLNTGIPPVEMCGLVCHENIPGGGMPKVISVGLNIFNTAWSMY